MEIVIGREGDQALKITDKKVSRRHCRIYDVGPNKYVVEDISNGNTTKIDGMEIVTGHAGPDSIIQLGPEFTARLSDLIKVAPAPQAPNAQQAPHSPQTPLAPQAQRIQQPPAQQVPGAQPQPLTFDISHLQWIWEHYEDYNLQQSKKSRKINLIRSGSTVFTVGSGVITGLIPAIGAFGYVITSIGLLGMIYSMIGLSSSESPEDKKRHLEELEEIYICPNPACRKNFPIKSYKYIFNNYQRCPHCKCNYVHH